jgi:hypothetical protein
MGLEGIYFPDFPTLGMLMEEPPGPVVTAGLLGGTVIERGICCGASPLLGAVP